MVPPKNAISLLRLRPERAQAKIREIAKDTLKVILGDHARQRMQEREISDIEVYRILQTGHVMEEPVRTERKEWKCKVVKGLRGTREIGIVAIILPDDMLFIKTVEWEDLH